MGRPSTFVVEIAFSGGWSDVTAYHDYHSPTTIKRGRNSVLDTAQPGTLSLTLFNNDGRFSPTSGSPYWPNVRPNVMIRVTVNGSVRFYGYVDDWTPVYGGNSDVDARVQVTATDRTRIMSRHKFDSTYVETVRAAYSDASIWQWDGTGRICPDIMGNSNPSGLVSYRPAQYGGSRGTITYGETGPTRVSSGVHLVPGTLVNTPTHNGYLPTDDSSGDVIGLPQHLNFSLDPAGVWSLGFWAKIDNLYDRNAASGITLRFGATIAGCDGGNEWSVWIEGNTSDSGYIKITDNSGGFVGSSSPNIYDFTPGRWRYWMIVWNGSFLRVYLDGQSVVAATPAPYVDISPTVSLMGYAFPSRGRVWNHPDVTVAAVTYVPHVVSTAEVGEFYNASVTGFAGETTWERAQRLFTISDLLPGTYLADNGPSAHWGSAQATHGPFDTAGKSALELGQETAQAERGLFFVSPGGTIRMADRYARGMSSTPAATFDQEADTSGSDYSAPLRDAQIVNRVTVTTVAGGTAGAQDVFSQALNGVLTGSHSLNLNDTIQAGDYAAWVVSQFAYPRPRIASVTVDLLTSSTVGIYSSAFALDIGSRIKVTGLPTTGVSTVFEGFVEGFTEVYSLNEVSLTLDTSAVTPGEIVLDDTKLGRFTANGETTAGINAVSTSLSVGANPGFYWTGADLPYDIVVGTEQMTVTGGTAPSPSQTLTVTRGVNGTTATAHNAGEQVNIANEIVLGY